MEFLLVAEDCGLIVPIGRWVLKETCRQVQERNAAGLFVTLMQQASITLTFFTTKVECSL